MVHLHTFSQSVTARSPVSVSRESYGRRDKRQPGGAMEVEIERNTKLPELAGGLPVYRSVSSFYGNCGEKDWSLKKPTGGAQSCGVYWPIKGRVDESPSNMHN